jgi:hypothetical protein
MKVIYGQYPSNYVIGWWSGQYDGSPHPSIYCRRCGVCLNWNRNQVGWCESCDIAESNILAARSAMYGKVSR